MSETTKLRFRVIDTGVRDGRRQIAFDAALIELHKAGLSPDTVRFLRFPPTVLVGRHQNLARDVRLDVCRGEGIGLARRITGGGAIYLDAGQCGWEIVLSRRRLPMDSLDAYGRAISEAVAAGLEHAFGLPVQFRPPTDIVVADRKLCGTGGYFDGDTLVYQGTVLIDVDPVRIASVLNFPPPTANPAAPPPPRLTTLKAELRKAPSVGDVQRAVLDGLSGSLGLALDLGTPSAEEEQLATQMHDAEIGTDAFVLG